MKQFVLKIEYGTGKICMLCDTPDIVVAIQQFKEKYKQQLPDAKEFGVPDIIAAELLPLSYISKYEMTEG